MIPSGSTHFILIIPPLGISIVPNFCASIIAQSSFSFAISISVTSVVVVFLSQHPHGLHRQQPCLFLRPVRMFCHQVLFNFFYLVVLFHFGCIFREIYIKICCRMLDNDSFFAIALLTYLLLVNKLFPINLQHTLCLFSSDGQSIFLLSQRNNFHRNTAVFRRLEDGRAGLH